MKTSTKLYLIEMVSIEIENLLNDWDGSPEELDKEINKLQEVRRELLSL